VLYSVPQLRLLILLALTLLVGLGVREWRAGFPEAAERLERFDRDESPALLADAPPPAVTPPVAAPPASRSSAPATGAATPQGLAPLPGPSTTAPPVEPLDVNRAEASDLARLPGVGAGLAQRIVEERERRGRFDSPEALRYVLGMGPKKLAAIRRFITVRE
jgi:competence ComEA-like helix-hairpin-helix protein